MVFSYDNQASSEGIGARLGKITTDRGEIPTPIFMPVGTKATVKAATSQTLKDLDAKIILGNTYHLYLRPGPDLVQKAGGLHKFMNWDRPILTDSGGFQVFSLAKLRKITEEGVQFQSHIDGSKHLLTPELSIQVQEALGSDIMMCFDECPALPATKETLKKSLELTLKWEERSLLAKSEGRNLFSIIQGGTDLDLRKESLERILEIEARHESAGRSFAGHAIGGLSVGEPPEQMYETVAALAPLMPKDKPRYLMGVGTPEDLIICSGLGVDMFDCVMPTRNARNGMLFTRFGNVKIKQSRYKEDFTPIEEGCECYTCQNHTRAYLRHLYISDEILSSMLMTIHNLHFYLNLMSNIRNHLKNGDFVTFQKEFLSQRQQMI